MTSALITLVAAGAIGSIQDKGEIRAAIATFQRLTAAIPGELPPSRTPEERAVRPPLKARLDQLLHYTIKMNELLTLSDRATPEELFNLLQVSRDLVDAGTQLTVLPEEALCWQRAGLNLATAYHRMIEREVMAGTAPPQMLNQCRAQVELVRAQYVRTHAECLKSTLSPDR